jgi:hypothetical protein
MIPPRRLYKWSAGAGAELISGLPEYKMKRRLFLDVVVAQSASILELLAGEDEALLVWGNTLLVLDLALHIINRIGGLHLD